jgi:hypothetical protein
MQEIEQMMTTAGGRIECARCTARSKRTGEQCKKPALRASRTEKCEFHGGRSSGPLSEEGKASSAAANFRTGEYTKVEIDKADRSRALFRTLEDAAHVLGLVPQDTPRTRGRKPKLYLPVASPEDVLPAIMELRG